LDDAATVHYALVSLYMRFLSGLYIADLECSSKHTSRTRANANCYNTAMRKVDSFDGAYSQKKLNRCMK
jgi:hypothetical protein